MKLIQQISFGLIFLLLSCEPKPEVVIKKAELSSDLKLNLKNYNVAFLIMDGTFNTELTAPYDVFHHTKFRKDIKAMNVFTVANTNKAITTYEGLKIIPDLNYLKDRLPQIDILVIPSAAHNLDSDLEDVEMIKFVKQISINATYVISHCDGAFVLAKAGILDGHVSTTFPANIDVMRKMFPNLDIRDSTLFVHDGKIITSAGGAKSFEASLYLCELLYGKKNADEIAEGMVIDWDLETTKCVIVDSLSIRYVSTDPIN